MRGSNSRAKPRHCSIAGHCMKNQWTCSKTHHLSKKKHSRAIIITMRVHTMRWTYRFPSLKKYMSFNGVSHVLGMMWISCHVIKSLAFISFSFFLFVHGLTCSLFKTPSPKHKEFHFQMYRNDGNFRLPTNFVNVVRLKPSTPQQGGGKLKATNKNKNNARI